MGGFGRSSDLSLTELSPFEYYRTFSHHNLVPDSIFMPSSSNYGHRKKLSLTISIISMAKKKMLMRLRKKKPDYVIFQAQQRPQSNLDISGLLTTIQITINALITKSILWMADWILWRALGRYIVYLDTRLDNVYVVFFCLYHEWEK